MSTKSSANNNRSAGASTHTDNTFGSNEELINQKEFKNNGSQEDVSTEISHEKSEINETDEINKKSPSPITARTSQKTKIDVKQPVKYRKTQKYTPPQKKEVTKSIKKPIQVNENNSASQTNLDDQSQLYRNITDASSLKSQELESTGSNAVASINESSKEKNERTNNFIKKETTPQSRFKLQQLKAQEPNKSLAKSSTRNTIKVSNTFRKQTKLKESITVDNDEMKSRNNQSSFARNPTGTYSDQHNSTVPKQQKQQQNTINDQKTGMLSQYGYHPYGFPGQFLPQMGQFPYNQFPYNPHNYSDQRNTIKNPINIDPNNSSIAYHMSLYHMNMMRPNFYEQNDKIQLPSDLPYYFGQANSSYFYKWKTTEESTEKQRKAVKDMFLLEQNKTNQQTENTQEKSKTELPDILNKETTKNIGRNSMSQSPRRSNFKANGINESIKDLPEQYNKTVRKNSKFPNGVSNLQKTSAIRDKNTMKSDGPLQKNSTAIRRKAQANNSRLSNEITKDLTDLSKEEIKDLSSNNTGKQSTRLTAK